MMPQSKNYKIIFYLLSFLIVVERFYVILYFGSKYSDTDQLILWQALKDLSNVNFYGPYFYGQMYNPMLEAWLAFSFYKMGLNFQTALSISTSILALTPFFILAFFLKRKHGLNYAILPLIVLLLMPANFSYLTTISRGFITGFIFVIMGLVVFLNATKNWSYFVSGLLIGVAFFMNLNSLLILPLFLLKFKEETLKENLSKTPFFIIGLMSYLGLIFLSDYFYSVYPFSLVHETPTLKFGVKYFFRAVNNLDIFFNKVTPLFGFSSYILLLTFPILGFVLYKKNRGLESLILFVSFTEIIACLFLKKVNDGTNSIFFAGDRMFLALPFLYLFLFIFIFQNIHQNTARKFKNLMVFMAIFLFGFKIIFAKELLKHALSPKYESVVKVFKIEDLRKECQKHLAFTKRKAEIVIALSASSAQQDIIYGCNCLIPEFPSTLNPSFERRPTLMDKLKDKKPEYILFQIKHFDSIQNLMEMPLKIVRQDDNLLFVKNDSLSLKSILLPLKLWGKTWAEDLD